MPSKAPMAATTAKHNAQTEPNTIMSSKAPKAATTQRANAAKPSKAPMPAMAKLCARGAELRAFGRVSPTKAVASERPETSASGPLTAFAASSATVASTASKMASIEVALAPGMVAAILTAASSVRSSKATLKFLAKLSANSRPVCSVSWTKASCLLNSCSARLLMFAKSPETLRNETVIELASASAAVKLVFSFALSSDNPTESSATEAKDAEDTTAAEIRSH
mmetsp:Transcript_75568/g.212875  ORF Transcript_75568/g.212875 Transcript_75568/m.212875 type:complete len:224 (+) Transcript_75568:112-783(+)